MPEMEKSKGELLSEGILSSKKHPQLNVDDDVQKEVNDFCEGYKSFLDNAKTEREAVIATIDLLKKEGFSEFDPSKKYMVGDKIYQNIKNKALIFAVIGKQPLEKGIHLVASHIDSPRLDLKQNPLYEKDDLALLKTHYYGGIRKYQWVTIPLAMHGVVAKKDGTVVNINIGEDCSDPIFYITDLLPHLSQEQNERKLNEGIKGEELNVLIGSVPFKDDKASEKIKLNVMKILNEKYGIVEDDFTSADLTLVPAYKSRDVGIDRSMLASYGQDDRVCAYTSIAASLEVSSPEYTWVNILADREEIGSSGNTGLQSRIIEYFVADLAKPYGVESRTVLSNSRCLSADVNAAFDPTFPEVLDPLNGTRVGYGVGICKYTGARGKSDTSEASAEFLAWVRNILDSNNITWQTGELGRVDLGGGGTVAQYIANLGVEVLDVGVPVLAMHSPFEVVGKFDVYQAYRAFKAFLEAK